MTTRGRGVVALCVAVALAVVISLSLAGNRAVDDGSPSSRSAGLGGTLALHDWLGGLGLDVRRLSGRLDLGGTDVLLVIEPTTTIDDSDATAMTDFVRGGGTLVLALDTDAVPAATTLLDRLGQPVVAATNGGVAVPLQPIDPAGAVHRVPIPGRVIDLGAGGGHGADLLGIGRHVVLRGLGIGSGRAYVLGSTEPLRNDGLRADRRGADGTLQSTGSDAALLALALVEHARPPAQPPLRVAFDEVHHGEGPSDGAAAILITPLGLALLLAAVAVLVHLAAGGRRLGRPVPAGDPGAVPSATAYIRDVAGLLARSNSRGGVADRLAAELTRAIAAATGRDASRPDPELLAGLAGHDLALRNQVAATLAEARRLGFGNPDGDELLALGRQVDAAVRALRPGGATP